MGSKVGKHKDKLYIIDGQLNIKIGENDVKMNAEDYIDDLLKILGINGVTDVKHVANGNTIGTLKQLSFKYEGFSHYYHIHLDKYDYV